MTGKCPTSPAVQAGSRGAIKTIFRFREAPACGRGASLSRELDVAPPPTFGLSPAFTEVTSHSQALGERGYNFLMRMCERTGITKSSIRCLGFDISPDANLYFL